MRLRNITGSRELIADSPFVAHRPEEQKGHWCQLFQNSNPVYLEIGMGKGQFLVECARQNPDINYLGIEKYSSVLLRAVEKQQEEQLPNLYFIRFDAEYITGIFEKGEISRIYLNFSDPWPKDRHAKRRLTSRQFLERYDAILAKNGQVEFKTDNRALFEFSLNEVQESAWILCEHTFDLHHDTSMNAGNIMTEYEERFSSMGNPIHKMIIKRPCKEA